MNDILALLGGVQLANVLLRDPKEAPDDRRRVPNLLALRGRRAGADGGKGDTTTLVVLGCRQCSLGNVP